MANRDDSAADRDDPVAEEFQNNLGRLKIEYSAALAEAAGVQFSMQPLLQHEARRLERKLGPEHPRTRQLMARLQTNVRLARTIELERQLMRIEVPEVAVEGALVHGRIVGDEDGLGIDGLTVRLVGKSGAPAPDTGEATSDASGYFALRLEPEAVDHLVKRYPGGIFLAVLTPRRRNVHQQPGPLALARGARPLVEIRLRRDDLAAAPPTTPANVAVPDLLELTESKASAALRRAGLKSGRRETKVSSDRVGRVIDQSPAAGTKVSPGSSVSLVVGAQAENVEVPPLTGRTLKEAGDVITGSGLVVGTISGPSPADASIVRDQDPKPGTKVRPGTKVNLEIESEAQNVRARVLGRMAEGDGFDEIGVSTRSLENRLEARGIQTIKQLTVLLDRSDRALRDELKLPSLKAANTFKSLLQKALGKTG